MEQVEPKKFERIEKRSEERKKRREIERRGRGIHRAVRAAASHAKQKSLSLRLNMIPHLLSMY